MYYNKLMRAKLLIPIICTLLFPLYAAEPTGSALSVTIENNLTKKGFVCARTSLAATAQDDFPFNVEVYCASSAPKAQTADAPTQDRRNTIIFSFLQEDAYAHFDAITDFLQSLTKTALVCNVFVLFAAQDQSPFNPALSGTGVFAQDFDENDRAAAITVRFSDATAIQTGNAGTMTPLWLTQQLTAAFDGAAVPYTYPHRFTALYRAGFLRGEQRMATFIRNGIPAAAVTLSHDDDIRALQFFCEQFSADGTEWWDNHYIFLRLPAPFKNLWIGEQFFFLFCMILGTLFLLILCSFSFVGKNGADYKQDFKRSWYLIPLTIAVTYGAFWLGQTCCAHVSLLVRATPIVQFGIKLIFALLFISVLFAVQQSLRVSSIQFTHGYFIYLVGISNIFIFTAVDISFFALFLVEYLLIYIARKATRIVPLGISVFLMLLPFVPYVYDLLKKGYYVDLQPLVFSPPLYNLLLSMLVFPFLIMWLRMLVRMEFYAATSHFSLKTMLLQGSLSTGVLIVLTVLGMVGISVFSRQTLHRTPFAPVQSVNENRYTFEITATKDAFQGMTTRHVTIASKAAAAHYDITLSSESSVPLYDSTYDYTVNEETQTATFTVPDYPPQTMTIDYAASSADDATFFVTAWFPTDQDGVFRKESHAYIINGDD